MDYFFTYPRKFFWLSFFCFFPFSFSLAQIYNFENFSVEDGLSQNQILSICQDSRGYIWFGTNGGGVSIYDGTGFKAMSQSDGLASNVVFSIVQDDRGRMIFCTNGGLSIYNGSEFANYTTEEGLPHNMVFCVFPDNEALLLGTAKGVVKLSEGKIVPFSEDKDSLLQNTGIWSIYRDSKENIWFGTLKKGAVRYNPLQGLFTTFSTAEGLDHPIVRTLLEDRDGNMWIGTIKGLNKMDSQGRIKQIRMKENETTITVTSSFLSRDGALWFGTLSGLDKYISGKAVRYTETNGLVSNSVMAVLEDREGNLWMGTDGKGVAKLRCKGEVFRNYSIKNNLPNDNIFSVYQDRQGSYWFGSPSGIARMDRDGTIETFSKTKDGVKLGLASSAFSIAEDKEGNLWFATRKADEACLVYDGKKFTSFSKEDGFSDNTVNFVFKDRQDVMWFGTNDGVAKKEGNIFSLIPGMEKKKVWWILQDTKSHFWFATDNGAIKYDGTSFQYFTKKDGFVDGRVRTVVQDAHKIYWFATDEGVFSYDSKNFKQVDQAAGLSSNTAYSLLLDGKYSLWIGTNKGLNRLNIDRYFTDSEIIIKQYSKEDGFIGVECNGNAAFKDNKGHLWFGTVKGATIFNPEMETVNTTEPITHITNLRLDFEKFNWMEYSDSIDRSGLPLNLVLPYNKNHLTFDFVGVSLTIPQKVKYQYKLEPLESAFIPPTSQNEAVYPHLPPGEYKFILKAKNNDDYWNSKPVEYNFVILPPWYKTWWFYSLCIIALVAGIWSFIVMREKNLRKQKQVLEMQVQERTAELRKEKEKVEQINLEVLEKNKIIEDKNKDITDSITYAQGIQEAILPPDDKFKKFLPDSFILFRPRDIVSGDFYWMEVVTETLSDEQKQYVLLAVCDCTGHGVPGGFVSIVGHNGLTRTVNEQGIIRPAKILDSASLMVEETFRKGSRKDGMDAVLCRLSGTNDTSLELEFAAANNPLYLTRRKENGPLVDLYGNGSGDGIALKADIENDTHWLYQVSPDKQPVGAYEFRQPFTSHRFRLKTGDTLYLSSDGFRDQFGGPKGKKFMAKNFKQILISIQGKAMDEQHSILSQTIDNWMKDCEQNDDICVIGVRV